MNEIALICNNITKTFRDTTAVHDLSLSLNNGQFLALLGPSGCGKTTSLRLIAGLERPTSGTMQINSRTVAANDTWIPPNRRQIGLVFQDYALFPHMNVFRNITYGLHGPRHQQHQRMSELLELVGLSGLEKRMPYELSGGQQQRVALARALAPAPSIMLLDEPFSNLDAGLRLQVRQDMHRILKSTSVTVILVTHDQEEAFSFADEVGVMLDGTLQQIASPRSIYQTPATPNIASFVGTANFIPANANGDTAQCILGTVQLHAPIHGPVDLMLRPESLRLMPDEAGSAEIIQITYLGHDQLIKLHLNDTTLLARSSPETHFFSGQRVRITLSAPAIAYPKSL